MDAAMNSMPLPSWSVALITALVGVAMVTDLRWRRIPNSLTFPAALLAVVLRTALQGWAGLGLALGGALVAPTLLLLMHRGRGLGMGDIKLAMAVGAVVGPVLGVATMLVSAIAGGVMAVAITTAHGRGLAPLIKLVLVDVPIINRFVKSDTATQGDTAASEEPLTMPYGVAIGVGTLITLAACWWTGQDAWFLSFVGIAGSR
jgi:prepilin peptidase CpaA